MNKFFPIALLFIGSNAAYAMPVYTYSTEDLGAALTLTSPTGGVNPAAGDVTSLSTSFDEGNQIFTWAYDAKPGDNNVDNNGFWLVVSDGPNPKGDEDEYAILYGDLDANRVSAYVYNGLNKSNSFNSPGIFLDSFDNAISSSKDANGVTSVALSIDTSVINGYSSDPSWDGVSFGDQLGIWFHPTANTTFTYGTNTAGKATISSFSRPISGWYDTNGALTTTVPEPSSFALLSVGALAGFGVFRRRRS